MASCTPSIQDARGENTKINYGMDTRGEKEERTSKEKNRISKMRIFLAFVSHPRKIKDTAVN
jgi:hypothetical protein